MSAAVRCTPVLARARFRSGLRVPTAGWTPGFTQANLIAVPAPLADDLRGFIEANPKPCPLLEAVAAGSTSTTLAPGADLRTDLPAYRVWVDGECVDEVADATAYWRPGLTAFLIGCSFTFEQVLVAAGVPVRHLEQGVNVAMFRTDRPCRPVGPFAGPLVVSMRPIPERLVSLAIETTARYPAVHGGPVHVGDPSALGIADLGRPDYGEPVASMPGDVPVFWACGVTPQAAVTASRLPFALTHAPGHMLITDVPDTAYRR